MLRAGWQLPGRLVYSAMAGGVRAVLGFAAIARHVTGVCP